MALEEQTAASEEETLSMVGSFALEFPTPPAFEMETPAAIDDTREPHVHFPEPVATTIEEEGDAYPSATAQETEKARPVGYRYLSFKRLVRTDACCYSSGMSVGALC